jgi:hypothetical protein
MEWIITVNEESKYVEIVTSGVADESGSLAMAKAIPQALGKYEIKNIIIDHRNISSVSGKVADVYSRPKQFQEMGVIHGIKVAVIVKAEHKDFFKFLELIFVNRGYLYAVFNEKKPALDWLLTS